MTFEIDSYKGSSLPAVDKNILLFYDSSIDKIKGG
jgi:hypothetical protein